MRKKLSHSVTRIGLSFCSVDLVQTSSGLVRVGGMPGLAGLLKKSKFACDHVIVLPPEVTMSGDNHAGEETVLWNELNSPMPKSRTYIGEAADLRHLMRRVRIGIGLRPGPDAGHWADDPLLRGLVRPMIVPGISRRLRLGPRVEILFADDNIEIVDDHKMVYDFREFQSRSNISYEMEKLFEGVARKTAPRNAPAVFTAGSANGPGRRTPSFIVRYGKRSIWIDPCALPLEVLSRHGLAADAVTDILLTSCGEEHDGGIPALLKRAKETRRKIDLVTTVPIYADLKARFNYLFQGGMDRIVNLVKIQPSNPLPYHKGLLAARFNLNSARRPSLGVKIGFNGREIAISGETDYDENAAAALARPDLGWQWFRNSDLIFHEADFKDPGPGHTRFSEIQKLKKKVKGKLFVYGSSRRRLFFSVLCREGVWYEFIKGRIRIRKARGKKFRSRKLKA